MCVEAHSFSEAVYFYEVVGEIDSTKDDTEVVWPLAIHLREGFLGCNIFSITVNMCTFIEAHKETCEKKLFQNHFISEPGHEHQHKFNLELFGNGYTK